MILHWQNSNVSVKISDNIHSAMFSVTVSVPVWVHVPCADGSEGLLFLDIIGEVTPTMMLFDTMHHDTMQFTAITFSPFPSRKPCETLVREQHFRINRLPRYSLMIILKLGPLLVSYEFSSLDSISRCFVI